MNTEIKNMIKNEVIKQVNVRIKCHGFHLINPASIDQRFDDGMLWLADQAGEFAIQDIDIFEYTEGFDLLKLDAPFGFEDYVSNLCDILLSLAGIELVTSEDEDIVTNIEIEE